MESHAPISDLITGTVLYNRLVEDVVSGETELTISEYRILFYLALCEGRKARIRTLADALVLSSSTVSDAVKDLERKALVRKVEQTNDLKAVWASITDEGMRAFERGNDAVLDETREYWDIVGEKLRRSYFRNVQRFIEQWDHPLQNALELSGPIYYAFVSRCYLLGYISWFKSTYNLSLIDVRILMLLLERGTPLSCTDIAHLLRVSNSAVSNAVRRLSRVRSYVERERGYLGQEIAIALTHEGADRIREIRERFIQFNLASFDISRHEFDEMLNTVHPRHRKSYMQRVFGEDFG